jgi:hypothetical protein
MRSCVHSLSIEPKKLLVLSVNGMLCHFPPSTIVQGNAKVFGNNVNKTKMEVRVGVENFFSKAFQKFHITIWFYMKFEDLL